MSDKITTLIHHPYKPPEGFAAPQPGVFKASTVIFPNVAAMRRREWKDKTGYTYGLHGTPTTYLLEERLCALEGGHQCVLVEFPDLVELVRICRSKNVLCALDNTWGAGLAFQPFEIDDKLGVDISIHALTKYPSGGGDVLMGSIITRDQALHLRIKLCHMRLGLGVGANDVEAVLRSLPSLALRYQAHDAGARELANWCLSRPEFAQVLHPALPASPGHAHWQAVCKTDVGGAAGLFSVIFNASYTQAQVDAFCDALRLFKLGYSWGGPMSLVVPYETASLRKVWPAHLAPGCLVRFSVGLEAIADLQADLARALAALPDC
jgi:cystathionine beta-lyase